MAGGKAAVLEGRPGKEAGGPLENDPGVVDGASKEPDGSDGVTGAGEYVTALGRPVFPTDVPDGFAAKAGEPEGPTGTELGEPRV